MTGVLADGTGPPACGADVEPTGGQFVEDSATFTDDWYVRRTRRLPVPGFTTCPYPGWSGDRQVVGNVGLNDEKLSGQLPLFA